MNVAFGSFGPVFTTYRSGWGTGGYHRLCWDGTTTNVDFLASTVPSAPITLNAGGFNPVILVAKRTGTGTGAASFTIYDMTGAVLATGTGTQDAMPVNPISIGYVGLAGDQLKCCFAAFIGAAINSTQEAATVANLVSTVGGWTP